MVNSSSKYLFFFCRYTTYNDVGSYTAAYYPGQAPVASTMSYDISADYVDSTTTYDPRPGLDTLNDNGALIAGTPDGE